MFRILAKVHQWLGATVGLAVLAWLLSGLVLLFVPYPRLTETEWFAAAPAVALDECKIEPARLLSMLAVPSGIEHLRVVMVGARPAAVATYLDGRSAARWADTGEPVRIGTAEHARRIVEQIEGESPAVDLALIDDDVWTVHQRFDPYRPLWKVEVEGTLGRVLYLSSITGEFVQDTERWERGWNLMGATVHWWYLPWLRRQWDVWDVVVWWTSAAGFVMVLAGGLLGLTSWRHRIRKGERLKLHRLHLLMGAIGGLVMLCWTGSGWLSMDHGRWFSRSEVTALERERLMGGRLQFSDLSTTWDQLKAESMFAGMKEFRFAKVGGRVAVIGRLSPNEQAIVMESLDGQTRVAVIPLQQIETAARSVRVSAMAMSVSLVATDDPFHHEIRQRDRVGAMVRVAFEDTDATWMHIDGRTGSLIEKLDRSQRLYRRLFDGLHRWDLSWMREHETIRKGGIILCSVIGTLLAGSGVLSGVLRWREPRRKS